jgi:hypothetical protein
MSVRQSEFVVRRSSRAKLARVDIGVPKVLGRLGAGSQISSPFVSFAFVSMASPLR